MGSFFFEGITVVGCFVIFFLFGIMINEIPPNPKYLNIKLHNHFGFWNVPFIFIFIFIITNLIDKIINK
jgi:hypothetical protein